MVEVEVEEEDEEVEAEVEEVVGEDSMVMVELLQLLETRLNPPGEENLTNSVRMV